ncbi:MAG TPA: hypothetical protein VGP72_15985 [Planctomycetota bacterium]|jgi:hypothetical protein
MDPREFMLTAEELLAKNGREADCRSAVSRAYYATYQMLRVEVLTLDRRLLSSASLAAGKMVPHQRLIDYLKGCDDAKVRAIGVNLDSLKDARHDADYDLHLRINAKIAEQEFEKAKLLQQDITSIGPRNVVRALETYLRKTFGQ